MPFLPYQEKNPAVVPLIRFPAALAAGGLLGQLKGSKDAWSEKNGRLYIEWARPLYCISFLVLVLVSLFLVLLLRVFLSFDQFCFSFFFSSCSYCSFHFFSIFRFVGSSSISWYFVSFLCFHAASVILLLLLLLCL